MLFLALSGNLSHDFTVTMPDTVLVNQMFQVQVTYSGTTGISFNCIPEYYSPELRYSGTSTSSSYRSISTPSGRQVSTEVTVSLSFSSSLPGTYTIGPILLSGTGLGNERIPAEEVVIAENPASHNNSAVTQAPLDADYWIEVDYDTDGSLYPDMSFTAAYYLCSRYQNIDLQANKMTPSEYLSETVVDQAEYLEFRRVPKSYFRADIVTVEFTTLFPCTVSLPRMETTIARRSIYSTNKPVEIISPEINLPVYPFPDEGMPENFTGIGDSISFNIDRLFGSFSTAGEISMRLYITGPGAEKVDDIPELTLFGPAELSYSDRRDSGGIIYWDIVIHPDDSGSVTIGLDSVAWFDRENYRYRQALIPACTLAVRAPIALTDSPVLPTQWEEELPVVFWIVLSLLILMLIPVSVFIVKRRKGRGGALESASDPEELLTAMEMSITEFFFGKSCWIGYDELDELLSDRNVDRLLTRRILRHWKNLELLLSRNVTDEETTRLRQKTIDLLSELKIGTP